jgi:hypothetical protein
MEKMILKIPPCDHGLNIEINVVKNMVIYLYARKR